MSFKAKTNSSGISMMTFRAFPNLYFKETEVIKESEFHVMLNPDDFKRTYGASTGDDETIGSNGSQGKNKGFAPESYSFSLIFDGTGIVDPKRTDVSEELDLFLKSVYRNPNNHNGQTPNFVEMIYCGELLHCKLSSLSVDYQLMDRDGKPLRIKLSCSFTAVKKKDPKEEEKKKTQTPKQRPSQNGCFCTCDNFDDTLMTATENGQDSLLSMEKNYSSAE